MAKKILLFAFVFLLSFQVVIDTDFGWHLKVGQYIWQTKSVPKHDIISYTLPTYPYVYHSWAGEVLTYLFYKLAGLYGVSALLAIVFTTAFFLIFKIAILLSNGQVNSLFLLWSAMASYVLTGRGMRVFGFLFLALVLFLFIKYQKQKSPLIWVIPFIFIIWASFHASFTIGIFTLAILVSLFKNFRLLPLVLVSILATLVNPYGIRSWQQAVTMSLNSTVNLHEVNLDWQPLIGDYITAITLITVVVGSFVLTKLFKVKTEYRLWIVAIIFLILTLITQRFVFVLPVVFIPLANRLIIDISPRLQKFILNSLPIRVAIFSTYMIILLFILGNLIQVNFAYKSFENYSQYISTKFKNKINFDIWPTQATKVIAENKLEDKKLLTEAATSGFLLLAYPDLKLYYYGAMDNFIVNGEPFVLEYLSIITAEPGWGKRLERSLTEAVLLPSSYPLVSALSQNPSWQTIYKDDQAALLVKRD